MDPKIRNLQNSCPLSFRYQKQPSSFLVSYFSNTYFVRIMVVELCYTSELCACLLLVFLSCHYFWMLAFFQESCCTISYSLFHHCNGICPAWLHCWNGFDEQWYKSVNVNGYCLGACIWAVPWSLPLLSYLMFLVFVWKMLFYHTFQFPMLISDRLGLSTLHIGCLILTTRESLPNFF